MEYWTCTVLNTVTNPDLSVDVEILYSNTVLVPPFSQQKVLFIADPSTVGDLTTYIANAASQQIQLYQNQITINSTLQGMIGQPIIVVEPT